MAEARAAAAGAGALAAAAALAAGELVGGLVATAPSLLNAVGSVVIDTAPPAVEDAAIAMFGTADKLALVIGTVVLSLGIGAGLGVAARTWRRLAVSGVVAFGALGLAAGLAQPAASAAGTAGAALVATATGVAALLLLMRRWDAAWSPAGAAHQGGWQGGRQGGRQGERRAFLRAAGATGMLAVIGGPAGRSLGERRRGIEAARGEVVLPPPGDPLPPPPPGLAVPGLAPLFVRHPRFFRIDTALRVPRVDLDAWRLEVRGLVARPFALTFDELLGEDLVEEDVTLSCVSNEVGGDLVGNARWLGVPLQRLLERAGVRAGAAQVVGRSVDGFTAAFPVAALDGRTALVAVGMNGEPLPAIHGFPARLVVAGLYGYVSATKWLDAIELVDADFEGYWIPRGWAKRAPVKTASRIDVPRHGGRVEAGRVAVAGVAWAPERGVARVQVQVDDGPWRQARLSASLGPAAWRQWHLPWDAEPGRHRLRVRATDGDGVTQPGRPVPPRPDGAQGWHTITVRVA